MTLHHLNTILYRAYAEIRAEVSEGFLGISLWILEPAVYMGAFYLVFEVLGFRGGADAVPFLLPGLVIWKWFASSVHRGGSSIILSSHIIQQIYVPKHVFIAAVLLSSFYQFLIAFGLLLLFLMIYGIDPGGVWWGLVPVIFVQFVLTAGVAGIFAVFIPFVPELKLVINNGLTLVFILSGIFFDISSGPEVFQKILYLNPMATLVEAHRSIFLHQVNPDWSALGNVLIFSVALLAIVFFLIRKWDREYPRVASQ